jgi:lipoprotein Spr
MLAPLWAGSQARSRKPVAKAPVTKQIGQVKQASKLPISLPNLSDSVWQKDLPLSDFDSLINNSRRSERSFNSPQFDLGKTIGAALENFLPFQFKYAILLNESVEKLSNLMLYKTIDDWYGTRYRYGGTSSRGIDCSAFMQVLSGYVYGWSLPRTAREQYMAMRGIPRDQLREGDFVFFNTTGGISHVGMYLQNNKFIHSATSQGVSIGDLNSDYWSRRFIGARRINNGEVLPATRKSPVK